MLTERTPGRFRACSRNCRKNAMRAALVPYRAFGSVTENVSRFFASKPGSTETKRTKLRISKPEPTSKTNARLICATTNTLRSVPRRRPAEAQAP